MKCEYELKWEYEYDEYERDAVILNDTVRYAMI
jgi:hypothetical protein